MSRFSARVNRGVLAMASIVVLGLAIRLALISGHRFHPDEALYATWARLIATGEDRLLSTRVVDKPPLLLYSIAIPFSLIGASEELARLPNLIAGTLLVVVTGALASGTRRDGRAAVISALFVAVSPMAALFSTTAFADPLMLLWAAAAALAACKRHPMTSGFLLGMAWATKQDAILFAPVVACEAALRVHGSRSRGLLRCAAGVAVPALAVFGWSLARSVPDYLAVSLDNFGGLSLEDSSRYLWKMSQWLEFARALGSEVVVLGSLALALFVGWRRRDIGILKLVVLATGWIMVHLITSIPAWDRYALPLVAIAGMQVGRSASQVLEWLPNRAVKAVGFAALLVIMVMPIVTVVTTGTASVARDERQAGIDLIGDYFWRTDTTATVLYYHGLGWELDYYTYGRELDRRWFATVDSMASDAASLSHANRLVVFGSWERLEESADDALRNKGLRKDLVLRTLQRSGNPAISLYRIMDAAE